MHVTQCPECRDDISVPVGLSLQAELECPLCGGDFPYEKIAGSIPPVVKVKNDPGGGSSSGSQTSSAVESGFAIDVGSVGSPGGPNGGPMLNDGKPASFVSDNTGPAPRTAPPRQRNPSGKKEKNMPIEALKVVLGGMLAFPLVQLGVWWIGGRDPLDLGPSVSKIVPFVVPQKHRGEPDKELFNEIVDEADKRKLAKEKDNQSSRTRDRSVNTGDRGNSGLATNSKIGDLDPKSTDPEKSDPENSDRSNSIAAKEPDNIPSVKRLKVPLEDIIREKDSVRLYKSPEVAASFKSLSEPKRQFTPGQVNEVIATLIRSSFENMGEPGDDVRDEQFAQLVSLAERVTGLEGTERQISSAQGSAQNAVAQFAPHPLSEVSKRGEKWFANEANIGRGIAVSGVLKSIATSDELVRATVAWSHAPDSEVKIYSSNMTLSNLAIESEIITLGRIVDGRELSLAAGPAIVDTLTSVVN